MLLAAPTPVATSVSLSVTLLLILVALYLVKHQGHKVVTVVLGLLIGIRIATTTIGVQANNAVTAFIAWVANGLGGQVH